MLALMPKAGTCAGNSVRVRAAVSAGPPAFLAGPDRGGALQVQAPRTRQSPRRGRCPTWYERCKLGAPLGLDARVLPRLPRLHFNVPEDKGAAPRLTCAWAWWQPAHARVRRNGGGGCVGARQPGGRGRRRSAAGGAGAHRAPGRLRGARAGRVVRLGAWFVHLRATLPVQAGQVGRANVCRLCCRGPERLHAKRARTVPPGPGRGFAQWPMRAYTAVTSLRV